MYTFGFPINNIISLSLYTLWQEEEFKHICSRESLTEKAADIEKTIVVKEHERKRYNFDPAMFYENRFEAMEGQSHVLCHEKIESCTQGRS